MFGYFGRFKSEFLLSVPDCISAVVVLWVVVVEERFVGLCEVAVGYLNEVLMRVDDSSEFFVELVQQPMPVDRLGERVDVSDA